MSFRDLKVVIFVLGWLLITAVYGRIIGDSLRVYVAYYVYIVGWVLFLCVYCFIGATTKKLKQSILLIIVVTSLTLGMPIWIWTTWDRDEVAVPKLAVALKTNPNKEIRLAAAYCLGDIGVPRR